MGIAVVACLAWASTAVAQEPGDTPPPTDTEPAANESATDEPTEPATGMTSPAPSEQREYVEEARLLFMAGQRAFEDGRYQGAFDSFRRAFELTGDSALLYNIGVAADRLRRDQEAVDAFEEYLRDNPGTADRQMIRGRIRILREQIAEREFHGTPPVEPDDDPDPDQPARIPTTPPVDDEDDGFFSQWWVWAIAGALVIGGVTATLLVTRTESDPTPGAEGVVLYALETF